MREDVESWGGATGTAIGEITKIVHPADGMIHTSRVTYVGLRGRVMTADLPFDAISTLKEGDILPESLRA